jgi:glyoxylase-like metal-dependent hydrolase (beta-lactamase superfamily II)
MNAGTLRFKLGEFNCMAICDGTMTYAPPIFSPPADLLFANAPKVQLAKALSGIGLTIQSWAEWDSPYNCLLVETAKQRILVDTGADGLGPNTGKLFSNLQKEGIAPEDIDLVILTHAHGDHIGGDLNNEGKPTFPKARWVIRKDEWEFWTSSLAEKQLPERYREIFIALARQNLLPLGKQLDLIDKDTEIVPGIRAITAPGHTPGQMALDISSQGKRLMYVSDIVLHPLHLAKPEWCAAVDLLPDQTVLTRRKILSKLTAEKTLVMAYHFPFPGLGYIISRGKAWRWEPL